MDRRAQMSRLRMPENMRKKLGKGAAHKSVKDYRRQNKQQIFRAIDS